MEFLTFDSPLPTKMTILHCPALPGVRGNRMNCGSEIECMVGDR